MSNIDRLNFNFGVTRADGAHQPPLKFPSAIRTYSSVKVLIKEVL
jgi:hypothetical protein